MTRGLIRFLAGASLVFCSAVAQGPRAAEPEARAEVSPADAQAAELLCQRSLQAFHRKDFIASANLAKQSLKLNPDHAGALNLLGALLVEKRDFPAARELFAHAHKLEPTANTAFNLAEMDFVEKKWKNARKSMEVAMKWKDANEPLTSVARYKLMVIALKTGDKDQLAAHHAFFKKKGMQRELDFYKVLLEISTKNLDEKAAKALWRPLQAKHDGTHPYIDTLIEAYFTDAVV